MKQLIGYDILADRPPHGGEATYRGIRAQLWDALGSVRDEINAAPVAVLAYGPLDETRHGNVTLILKFAPEGKERPRELQTAVFHYRVVDQGDGATPSLDLTITFRDFPVSVSGTVPQVIGHVERALALQRRGLSFEGLPQG